MDSRSWLLLEQENPRWRLPDDLRARDPFAARDCGWVEQMRPFIRQFSRPGETVTDPFCGFASTLLAAHLEGRAGVGYEIEASRVELARERLTRHAADRQQLFAQELPEQGEPLDLCLGNLPYFGCAWSGSDPAQLYASSDYASYLQRLAVLFRRIAGRLRAGRYCILMAQNIDVGGHWLPQAWDVARVLSDYLQPCGERLLLYPKPVQALAPLDSGHDRSHEYALIFRKVPATQDLEGALRLLRELQQLGLGFQVYGSFGRWLQDPERVQPGDVDLLLPADEANLNALLFALQQRGFALTCWREPIQPPLRLADYAGRYYFRAERTERQGQQLRIDLTWELESGQCVSLGGGSARGLPLA